MSRPPKYRTAEDMQCDIDLYFAACNAREDQNPDYFDTLEGAQKDKSIRVRDTYPSICGLAGFLGMSRQALLDYEKKDEFLDTVKAAKQRVEAVLEQRLYFQSPTGAIFNLKNNFGWKDQQDINNRYVDKSGNDLSERDKELLEKHNIKP